MPTVYAGEPAVGAITGHCVAEVGAVRIYYPPVLRVRQGHAGIRILLKTLLWWNWLELEGARSIPVIQE